MAVAKSLAQVVLEEDTVGQTGQRIVIGEAMNLFFCPLALSAFLGFVQGSADRRCQPSEPIFQDIVGRTVLQGFHCAFLADGAGHEEKREIGAFLLCKRQGGPAVKGWHGVVAEDQVKSALVHRGKKLIAGLHPHQLTGNTV